LWGTSDEPIQPALSFGTRQPLLAQRAMLSMATLLSRRTAYPVKQQRINKRNKLTATATWKIGEKYEHRND
jgi:hypothetical protein